MRQNARFDANAAVANLEHYKTANGPNSTDLATATSIRAADPSTVVVRLAAPDPSLVNQLATAIGYMAAPNAIKSGELAKQPVGTGPYVLDASSTVVGSKYVFDENPKTWRKNVAYKTLEYLYMSDPNAALDALKGGQVNAAFLSDLQNAADAQRAGYKRVMFGAGPIGLYIFDRGGKITPALKDVRVRQAINYAINSKAIVDAYLGGTTVGTLTRQQFGPDSDAWDPAINGLYPYNPAKARELLAEAGYPNGFTVTMPYYPIVGTGVLDTVKAMLGAVGITVKYVQMPSEDVMPALLAGKYSMSLLSQGYVDDWSTMVDQLAATAPFNPFHVQDSYAQRLINQYQYASDAQRPAIAKQLNAYIVGQAWNNIWAYGMPSILVDTETTEIGNTTYPGYPPILDYRPVS